MSPKFEYTRHVFDQVFIQYLGTLVLWMGAGRDRKLLEILLLWHVCVMQIIVFFFLISRHKPSNALLQPRKCIYSSSFILFFSSLYQYARQVIWSQVTLLGSEIQHSYLLWKFFFIFINDCFFYRVSKLTVVIEKYREFSLANALVDCQTHYSCTVD